MAGLKPPVTGQNEQPEVLTATEARQGFRGKRALRILLASLALTAVAGLALFLTRRLWGG
jgi:hypothetical protein